MGNIALLFHCLKLWAFNCQLLAVKEAPTLHRGEGPQFRDLDLSREDQAPRQSWRSPWLETPRQASSGTSWSVWTLLEGQIEPKQRSLQMVQQQ